MFRRREFIQRITAAGAAAGGGASAGEIRTAHFQVKGFTCITCAVGLEVVLLREKGIKQAKAFYPEGKVTVGFEPSETSPATIREFINKTTGFTVVEEKS